jgi:Na+/proline symporter
MRPFAQIPAQGVAFLTAKGVWLFSLLAAYWAYCVAWGWRGARRTTSAGDHFVAGRGIGLWVYVLAASATSLSAWVFMGHAGLVYGDGLPYATAGLLAIAVPLSGVLFLKRQWMIGRRFGYRSAAEMYADYYRGEAIGVLVVVVAVLFAVPLVALQFKASGYVIEVLTDGLVSRRWGMGIIAVAVLVHVVAGGLRAPVRVGAAGFVLLVLGLAIAALFVLDTLGGWQAVQDGLARLGAARDPTAGTTGGLGGGDFNAAFAIPGVIQFTAGVDLAPPVGGWWTGVMGLSFLIAMMGVQASPAFTMWAFSNASPRAFAAQQVWASSFVVGLLLVVFAAGLGMGARLLGADVPTVGGTADTVVPHTLGLLAGPAPWLAGLIAAVALAVMQAVGTAYLSITGTMLSRDLYRRHLKAAAGTAASVMAGRLATLGLAALALALAALSDDALVILGGLAVACGVQMVPPLAGLVWYRWITRQGATWGLAAGLLGVLLTESIGSAAFQAAGLDLWGRWPGTIHSAAWGLAANIAVCVLASALTQDGRELEHRMAVHGFLDRHAALAADKTGLRPVAWIMVAAWLFFGAGPGAVIGNDVFGAPDAGVAGWTFGIPSLWAWQIVFWGLGVAMMWFLAYKMEMSTVAKDEIATLTKEGEGTPTALETPST